MSMSMGIEKKKFSKIEHYELPEYFKNHSWEDTDFYEITYCHGESIVDRHDSDNTKNILDFKDITGFNKPIGIIVSGKAEIYEMYITNNFSVYRPIRLMGVGDLLGDFSLLDYICCEKDKQSISRRGEKWKICAGFRSILITQNSDLTHFLQPHSSVREQHLVTDVALKDQKAVTIVFFEANFINKSSPLLPQLFLYSWPRSKMYRDSLNSFNFSQLLKFRRQANQVADRMKTQGIDKKNAMQLFIDAVWDAYNRPIRGEPMFVQASSEILGAAEDHFNKIGLSLDNVLVGKIIDFSCDEFWFPIDLNNCFIASNYDVTGVNGADRLKVESQKDVFYECMNKKKYRLFYIDFCHHLLTILASNYGSYGYEVSCLSVDGLEVKKPILMLKFKKTNKHE